MPRQKILLTIGGLDPSGGAGILAAGAVAQLTELDGGAQVEGGLTWVASTALGAAYIAGLHAGVFSSLDDIRKSWHCERRFAPAMEEPQRLSLYGGWRQAVARALA